MPVSLLLDGDRSAGQGRILRKVDDLADTDSERRPVATRSSLGLALSQGDNPYRLSTWAETFFATSNQDFKDPLRAHSAPFLRSSKRPSMGSKKVILRNATGLVLRKYVQKMRECYTLISEGVHV